MRKRPDRGPDAFELRIYLGRDSTGRVRHKSTLFRGTKRAAERELARLVANQTAAPSVVPEAPTRVWGPSTTINEAIDGWRRNGWDDLSPSTTQRYRSMISNHIEHSIGKRAIASLSPYDVEMYLRELKAKGLSEASVRQTRAVLHRACRLARKWSGNVLPNPVADTELPDWALHEQTEEVRAPTVAEVRSLLAAARAHDVRVHAFILLVAATGMRRGEACAIRWGDVDQEARVVTIDESVVAVTGGVVVKQPKSRAGVRRVSFDEGTARALQGVRRETDRVGRLAGFAVRPEQFVFAMELPGTQPPRPDTFSHAFSRVRTLAGVPADVHLHSLRHFQATALDSVISERQKQARLGWATVHMARHYTDGIEEEDQRAAEHIGRLLDGDASADPQAAQVPVVGVEG
ncbi:MAG: tyrosine-type recombinase/integrase [Acidimicrobiales bacterium]